MNKHYLMSKMKSSGTAYLCWFFFGIHYAYLGKFGLQILYWITLGGLGIWTFLDIFLIPGKVNSHNLKISRLIAEIERKEKEAEYARNLSMISSLSSKTSEDK
ncbi:TM2 domain-containing protein [Apibacter raozihei]|uniref:TM2 domain-containing protein n=1 Tax=Apibacter raozihei TaxID=2500547 RepID=UPI000FE3684A|nr:TM2 domain-containing protein [Apibacter raozihei]